MQIQSDNQIIQTSPKTIICKVRRSVPFDVIMNKPSFGKNGGKCPAPNYIEAVSD